MIRCIYSKIKQLFFTYWSIRKAKRNIKKLLKCFIPFMVAFLFFVSVPLNGFCADSPTYVVNTPLPEPSIGRFTVGYNVVYTFSGAVLIETTVPIPTNWNSGSSAKEDITFKLEQLYNPTTKTLSIYDVSTTSTSLTSTTWTFYVTAYKMSDGTRIQQWTSNYTENADGINITFSMTSFGYPEPQAVLSVGYSSHSSYRADLLKVNWSYSGAEESFDDGGYSDSSKTQKDELDSLGEDTKVEQPDADDLSDMIDDNVDSFLQSDGEIGFNILSTITNMPIVSTMLIIVFAMAILGYVLFGKR